VLSRELNRVERTYEFRDHSGTLIERVEVAEEIRPLTAEELRVALRTRGFVVEQEWWDYGRHAAAGAQYFTLSAFPR
jgi:hypothetical protein